MLKKIQKEAISLLQLHSDFVFAYPGDKQNPQGLTLGIAVYEITLPSCADVLDSVIIFRDANELFV